MRKTVKGCHDAEAACLYLQSPSFGALQRCVDTGQAKNISHLGLFEKPYRLHLDVETSGCRVMSM